MKINKIAVFTSGGDSPGMNACIRAVIRSAAYHNIPSVGIRRGYQGMIENEFMPMTTHSVSGIIQKGGTILGSARSKAFHTPEGRQQAYQNLKAQGIDAVVAIGGDGTFTGANVFMQEYPDIAFVGVPGTIDNDLYGTDFTIGYDTAINTAMEAIDKLRDTADAHNRLFFVEVMGRDAGFIALRTGIASGADAILVPESKTDLEALAQRLNERFKDKKLSGVVVVAEGDDAGGAFEIAQALKGKIPYEDIRVTVLGHIQRGGSPTCMDRVLASRLGVGAVEALLEGKKGVMIGSQNREIVHVPFENAIKHNQGLNPNLVRLAEILAL
jgi:6-phosphofructokinase 1